MPKYLKAHPQQQQFLELKNFKESNLGLINFNDKPEHLKAFTLN